MQSGHESPLLPFNDPNQAYEVALYWVMAGLSENPGLRHLAEDEGWVRENIIKQARTNFLPAEGWRAFATVVSLQGVQHRDQVVALMSTFVQSRDYSEFSGAFSRMSLFFQLIAKLDPEMPFTQLRQISRFLNEVSLDIGDPSGDFLDGLHQRVKDTNSCPSPLATVEIFARLYCEPAAETKPENHSTFKKRARVALQTGHEIPEQLLGSFIFQASSLPHVQEQLLISRWRTMRDNLPTEKYITLQMHEVVSAIHKINNTLNFFSLGFDTQRILAHAVIQAPSSAKWLADIVSFFAQRPDTATQDLQFLFNRLCCESPFPAVQRRAELARLCNLSLSEAPSEVERVPASWLRSIVMAKEIQGAQGGAIHWRGIKDPDEQRPLFSLLGDLFEKKNRDESRFSQSMLDRMLLAYDTAKSSHAIWNSGVAAEVMIRFFDSRSSADVIQCIRALRIALAVHHRLRFFDYEDNDALRVSLAVASRLSAGERPQRELIQALFARDVRSEILSAMKKIAANPAIDDIQFLVALECATEFFPQDWRFLSLSQFHSSRSPELPVNDIRHGLSSLKATSPSQLYELVRKRVMQRDLVNFIYGETPSVRERAHKELNRRYLLDTGPFPDTQVGSKELLPEYVSMLRDVKANFRGCFDVYYGFDNLTFECRTPPGCAHWLLVDFGLDCAVRVDILNTSSVDRYPGPGCILSGMRLDRILGRNPKTPDDPYSLFKLAMPWAKDEIEESANTRYVFARGLQAIIGPDTEKYYLDSVHYSRVVWNEHFLNHELEVAALVPTEVLRDALRGRTSQVDTSSRSASSLSAHGDELSFTRLSEACVARGLHFLNLGWPSNMGGLCNAMPPGSEPYFGWEELRRNESKDYAGHVHKSHIRGGWSHVMDAEVDRRNEPLRGLHHRINRISAAYRGLDYLCRSYKATWKKGWTLTDEPGGPSEVEIAAQEGDQDVSAENNEVGRNHLRMLVRAHRWHDLHKQGVKDRERFPVLGIGRTFDYRSRMRSPIVLDTFDLTLKLPSGKVVQLRPGTGGASAFEVGLWAKHVRPLIQRLETDLRELHWKRVEHVSNKTT